ncbi:MAG: hypothetical protein LBI42_14425 [Chitinispirillales bacterium]|jgi:predicted nucleic acid-binding protein|nr:hypothetical protein [Chitinispirillales bacterium]
MSGKIFLDTNVLVYAFTESIEKSQTVKWQTCFKNRANIGFVTAHLHVV